MANLRLNTECIGCIYNKFLKAVPKGTDEASRLHYAKQILRIIADASDDKSAPEIVCECTRIKNITFGEFDEFAELKTYFNGLMLGLEDLISENIQNSSDPIRMALIYALLGNYIDFGAMDNVDESKLRAMIEDAESISIDDSEVKALKADLEEAERLVYLTDNCGEIVFDKVFIKELIRHYPRMRITAIVRGENVLNDATLHDAKEVGLCEVVPVFGNGTGIAGTCIDRLPEDIRERVLCADIIISKGQGNFETLCYSQKNIYYLFMCKCKMFADRFKAEELCPMLLNDLRMAHK